MKLDPNKHPLYVILFAALVSGLFTAAIMALYTATLPIVRANERLLRQRAIVELFGLGDVAALSGEEVARLYDGRVREKRIAEGRPEEMEILAAYSQDVAPDEPVRLGDPRIVGYAFPIEGVGFWAMVRGYLAVTPDLERTLGIAILAHSETPGLGGRITEPEFKRWFRPGGPHDRGLDVSPPPAGGEFIHVGPPMDRTDAGYGRHVDALTGATGTSTAVSKFVNKDLRRFRRAMAAEGMLKEAP